MAKPLTLTEGRIRAMTTAFEDLSQDGVLATSVPFFSPDDLNLLIKQCSKLPMRQAKPRVGAAGREVIQDFDICFPAPRERALGQLADLLEETIAEVQNRVATPFIDEAFRLNDVAVQHYHPKSQGIGVHMDALRYRGVVFIITLAGQSSLSTCSDRDGNDARIINDQPGQLAVLSAPGFCGREGEGSRALHYVHDVTGGRLSIGLRHDTRPN